jgi:hypothetical protein
VAFIVTNTPADARGDYHHSIRHGALYANQLRYRTTAIQHGKRHVHRFATSRSLSLVGVTPVLAGKARQIVSACGSTIISTVSGRGHRSNHPIGRAVDMRGNPSCIYAHLKGWPGGYSIDYAAVQHVHISYNPGGQEWGLHFAHGGGHHRMTRYAGWQMPMTRSYARLTRGTAGQTVMLYEGKTYRPE